MLSPKNPPPSGVGSVNFRLNDGNVSRHTFERLDSLALAVTGKQITYKELTA